MGEEMMTTTENDLFINFAGYGTEAYRKDVIDCINEQISPNDRLNLLVSNDNLGGDFYPGQVKQLHIIYTFNGVLYDEWLGEGELLVIPRWQIIKSEETRKMDWLVFVIWIIVALGLVIPRIIEAIKK